MCMQNSILHTHDVSIARGRFILKPLRAIYDLSWFRCIWSWYVSHTHSHARAHARAHSHSHKHTCCSWTMADWSEVERLSAWAYSESKELVDASLQSNISAFWAWRMWWVFDSGGASAAQAGPSPPSSSTGIFAPITLCPRPDRQQKDHGWPGAFIRNLSGCINV
jgi:hypothetical protein